MNTALPPAEIGQIQNNGAALVSSLRMIGPFVVVLAAALVLPLVGNDYWTLIGTRAAIYWILVSGLNLAVGFGGQLAIGFVAVLTLGAYVASVLAAGTVGPAWPAFAALGAAGLSGAIAGVIVGLPALRLGSFYFAMTTLGFATIVTQVALAWGSVTGGGTGVAGPALPAPFDTTLGFYGLCVVLAALCTWMTANVAHSRFGRALIVIRDADVAAEAVGVSKPAILISIFLFAGAVAGVAGGLFASLQSYITPDAFTFDLSILFFIAILVGGRSSILGPLLGTIVLTVLPELAAPLVAWSTFLYAVMLLVIVLTIPGGLAELFDMLGRRPIATGRIIAPRLDLVAALFSKPPRREAVNMRDITLRFGALRAIDGLDLQVRPGEVHGLIGPNGSGKTTTLNVISGYYLPQEGSMMLGEAQLTAGVPHSRAAAGIARTFQRPRIVGEASVLQNVALGGTVSGRASFVETLLGLSRHRADEARLRADALLALRVVGLESLASIRADRLQHSELRFVEIARALMLRPAVLLLDEPAAGLAPNEIARLGQLIKAVAQQGTGVLLVEHHADLIFDICDHVTVLNLGRILAAGTPADVRSHGEVVSAYLGV
ncbi:ABC-type branched-subunit amino acid transport system ATPase component/ABC-type branched-subunit amino acid transport system permease subunit [Rhizobium sp. BK313]|uniref:branched-chain amino acid ABC transporter ATP-binding protein/permease n=1 Tax=Rhizobium sp. BK313 TaxID=2587081 RepID=UPI001060E6CE|nr:branched-chain amino acid ABC transporter ATP-binding protein/permease [Rhizobium sp. BK313]MBB3459298.1 ABC-type branched-subunit amino acid transport system ATPase component/ABC-type branched-subunit amino acid transport system permease subunit [Rhizobium sp. BK313]